MLQITHTNQAEPQATVVWPGEKKKSGYPESWVKVLRGYGIVT
jgi:hypothetical protein